MTKKADAGRLSDTERSAFLSSMRRTAAPQPARTAAVAAPVRDVSFETLPGFKMLKTQRAAADLLGLTNPFYQTHATRAGAQSIIGNRPVVNFASYDYLGLNGHPEITAAVAEAAAEWGTSVSASRLTAGERPSTSSSRRNSPRFMRPRTRWSSSAAMPQCLDHRGLADAEGSRDP